MCLTLFGEVCFAHWRGVRFLRSEGCGHGVHSSAWIGNGAAAEDPRTAGANAPPGVGCSLENMRWPDTSSCGELVAPPPYQKYETRPIR